MEQNPYVAPDHVDSIGGLSRSSQLFLRGVGIFCGLFAMLWFATGMAASFSEPAQELYNTDPYLFIAIVICTFMLPPICFALFGVACWRCSSRLAIYGLLVLIPTALLYGIRLIYLAMN
jgi:hypothetical protein